MKTRLLNPSIFGLLFLISTILYGETYASLPTEGEIEKNPSTIQTYTWVPKKSNSLITKIQLNNGTIIKLRSACKFEDKDCEYNSYESNKQIIGITEDGQHEGVILNYSIYLNNEQVENVVAIEDYFGNKENVAFVILSERCNAKHRLCNRTHTYLLVPHKTFFRKYYVGVNVSNIKINLNQQNEIVNAQSIVSTGIDKDGIGRYVSCDFIKNLGFIDKRTKPKYIQYFDPYASEIESVFDDKEIRDSLVKNMGLNRFRLLRKNTSWGGAFLALKRYLVVEGCQRYSRDYETGIMIIDTFTGNIFWKITTLGSSNKPIKLSGGTIKIPQDIREDFQFITQYVHYNYGY